MVSPGRTPKLSASSLESKPASNRMSVTSTAFVQLFHVVNVGALDEEIHG